MNRIRSTGFTLIELLVVISIMAVLAALSSGAYFRIRAAQMITSTESTLQQANTGLERIWSAVRDEAEREFNSANLPDGNSYQNFLNFCGGPSEKDRAKALWMYLRLKNEFPQTFAEANSTIVLKDGANTIVTLRPKTTFTSKVPNVATGGNIDKANEQAAVLLYIILTEKGSRGETFSSDTLAARSATIQIGSADYKVFTDSWSTPLTYVRFYNNGTELNNRPYSRHQYSVTYPTDVSQDPLDVTRKFSNWTGTKATAARTAIGVNTNTALLPKLGETNWLPTIISAGPNRQWDYIKVVGVSPTMPDNNVGIVYEPPNNPPTDNIYSFRLRQFGARGD